MTLHKNQLFQLYILALFLALLPLDLRANALFSPAPLLRDSIQIDSLMAVKPRKPNIFARIGQFFSNFDTTYIQPNYYNFTVMAQNTNYFQNYRLSAVSADAQAQSISMRPAPSVKIGPYFGWNWIFLGYTFDVSRPKAMGKSSEFNLNLYTNMFGIDIQCIRNAGNFRIRRVTGFTTCNPKDLNGTHFSGLDASTLSISAYYVFNHRRFSYPAAYNQSTMQRRSQGSGMLGMGFSQQNLKFDYTQLPEVITASGELIDELKFPQLYYNYFYVSGGYAYNFVPATNWLIGASVMPSIGFRKAKGERIKGKDILLNVHNFSFDCLARLGVVWNNSHYFAGASFINNLYFIRKDRLDVANNVTFLNFYVGLYFNRKKEYR